MLADQLCIASLNSAQRGFFHFHQPFPAIDIMVDHDRSGLITAQTSQHVLKREQRPRAARNAIL